MRIDIKVDAGAYVPTKGHKMDAGYDLYAIWPKTVPAHGSALFDTGVHFSIPEGICGLLVSKSGLNVNMGITSTGLIDSGYTGSVRVKLYNHSDADYEVQQGEKISQIIFIPYMDYETNLVIALANTDRGDNGFGSTGKLHPMAVGKMCGEKTEVFKYDYKKYFQDAILRAEEESPLPANVPENPVLHYMERILSVLKRIEDQLEHRFNTFLPR